MPGFSQQVCVMHFPQARLWEALIVFWSVLLARGPAGFQMHSCTPPELGLQWRCWSVFPTVCCLRFWKWALATLSPSLGTGNSLQSYQWSAGKYHSNRMLRVDSGSLRNLLKPSNGYWALNRHLSLCWSMLIMNLMGVRITVETSL